jgi:hypothetical protein
MTRIYYATEFTKLSQNSELISLALVSDDGRTFYAEVDGWNREKAIMENPFLIKNVLPFLIYENDPIYKQTDILQAYKLKDCRLEIARRLQEWLMQFSAVEFWGDVQSYGWMHLCELFGGAIEFAKLNPNISYISMDVATRLAEHGFDPDTDRKEFARVDDYNDLQRHKAGNVLHKAYIIRGCYDRAEHLVKLSESELKNIKRQTNFLRTEQANQQNNPDFGWYEVGIYNGIEMCLGIIEKRTPDVWRHSKVKEVTQDRRTLLAIRDAMDALHRAHPNGIQDGFKMVKEVEQLLEHMGLLPQLPSDVIKAIYTHKSAVAAESLPRPNVRSGGHLNTSESETATAEFMEENGGVMAAQHVRD